MRRHIAAAVTSMLLVNSVDALGQQPVPDLKGKWVYRSLHNNTALIDGDATRALKLFFAEAQVDVKSGDLNIVKGSLNWSGEEQMDLSGAVYGAAGALPATVHITGIGRQGKGTAGWVYQYVGYVVPQWPGGVDQRTTIVGSVTRTVAHGAAPAGYVASFIMIKEGP